MFLCALCVRACVRVCPSVQQNARRSPTKYNVKPDMDVCCCSHLLRLPDRIQMVLGILDSVAVPRSETVPDDVDVLVVVVGSRLVPCHHGADEGLVAVANCPEIPVRVPAQDNTSQAETTQEMKEEINVCECAGEWSCNGK